MIAGRAPMITGIRAVSVPVEDQDAALAFYTSTLGFRVARDVPTPNGRWIELVPGGGDVVITLEPSRPDTARGAIAVRFTTVDAAAARASLRSLGVDADEVMSWPGVPPMFGLRDPDGNAFSITELAPS